MSDLNRTILVGRVTKDIELRHTASGTAVASVSIANNKVYTANGEKKEETSFFNCIAWGKTGEIIVEHCRKGQRIAIEGRLQQRSWDDQEGNKRSAVEIVVDNFQFLDSRQGDSQPQGSVPEPNNSNNPFSDEDLPF